jgi:Cns1/TTC4 Wheel domain
VTPTPRPPDLGPIEPYHLTDPLDPQSDLLFPTIFLYPLPAQSDLIAQLPLRTTLNDHLAVVLESPPAWDTAGEYTPETVECFMEIEKERGRGLIKVGKGTSFEKVLKGRVVLDGIIRIFVLPKTKSQEWIAEWKRNNTQA